MNRIFNFEEEFATSLRCIPMQVRYKLDTCGIKLKLEQWHRFSQEERKALLELSCRTESEIHNYRNLLYRLVLDSCGVPAKEIAVEENPLWMQTEVPESVLERARSLQVNISNDRWQKLETLERYALVKLSRSGHESRNFLPALQEFHLVSKGEISTR